MASLVAALLSTVICHASPVSSYLAYRFGASATVDEGTMHRHPDSWMLAGPRNEAAIREMASEPLEMSKDGTYLTTIANTIIFIEIRNGKVDPTANLEAIYLKQKQLVAHLLLASLEQNTEALAKIVTDVKNVSFGKAPRAGGGDMDQYAVILAEMPPYRVSEPTSDAKSRSVTYRIPIGSYGLLLKLVPVNGVWKIDTGTKLEIPLRMFFE
ncbi:MAG: hypothetical protein HZA93_21240 [Verrucomicrobia bacterium]|nr:hypothetical protein [Verrucomicrobiota bacterium]